MNRQAIALLFVALSAVSPVSGWAQASAQAFLAGGPRLGGPAEQELDLIDLRDQGVRVILDLRHPEEGTQAESEAAARLGFVYVNLPVREAASPAVVRNVGVLLDAYGAENVYLHCKSGQRAAEVWLPGEYRRRRLPAASSSAGRRRPVGQVVRQELVC